jgi:hypothetical protein
MDLFNLIIVALLLWLIVTLFRPVEPQTNRTFTIVAVVLLLIWLGHGYWPGHTIAHCPM